MLTRRINSWNIEAFERDPPFPKWRFVATHDDGRVEDAEDDHAPKALLELAALIGVDDGELLALYSL